MLNTGYVALHRNLMDHPLWQQLPIEWLKVWLCILMRANFKPSRWWSGSAFVELPAGAFVTSIDKLSGLALVSHRQVRGALGFLEKAGSVTRQTTNKYTVITICNWDTYQKSKPADDTQDGKPATSGRQTNDKPATTEEECLEESIREESKQARNDVPSVEDVPALKKARPHATLLH